jgi:hypothetical protein
MYLQNDFNELGIGIALTGALFSSMFLPGKYGFPLEEMRILSIDSEKKETCYLTSVLLWERGIRLLYSM